MSANGWLQILLFLGVIAAVTPLAGRYMVRVFSRGRTWLDPVLEPLERMLYRVCRIDPAREMRWTEYATALLAFSAVSMLVLYAFQRLQGWLPLNPQGFGAVSTHSSFNTAASFTSNTNWQGYSGESTMSYLTQMVGLAYHNFASAAVGLALAIAFIRGIARQEQDTIGNFWVDTTRGLLWILLPVCLVAALMFVSQGVVQNLKPYDTVELLEGSGSQTIAQGPVASQEAIKQFGTNGGGFFNANSAHPFENPTPADQLPADVAHFHHSRRTDLDAGRHGWRRAGMAGRSGLPWRSCSWPASRPRIGRKRVGIRCSWESTNARPTFRQAATWKGRKCALALRTRPSLPPSPRMRAAAP